jgi:AcrR family transcriptional regulator
VTVTRAPVSQEAIVSAALELLAEGGLEAVSFRRIATKLQVSAPTLYWHVESKRRLMDLMAEELMHRTGTAYDGPAPGQPWWEWLRADAVRMFEALIATRDAPRVVAGNRPSAESFAGIERVIRVLVDAGMTPGQAQQTLFALGAYVIGSATEWQAEAERARTQSLPDAADAEANAVRVRALADQPLLLAAISERLSGSDSTAFEYGLALLVDGLRARYCASS